MIRSGWPYCLASCHSFSFGHCFGTGISRGSPCGAPASAHRTMVATSSSLSDRSFWNDWIPTVLSRCQGGICLVATRSLIDFAHGRVSSYVTSDIGAIESLRWQAWHFSWKIGAISLAKVGFAGTALFPVPGITNNIAAADKPKPGFRNLPVLIDPPGLHRRPGDLIR